MTKYLSTCYLCNINFTSGKCPKCGRRADFRTPLDQIPERERFLEMKQPVQKDGIPYSKFYKLSETK